MVKYDFKNPAWSKAWHLLDDLAQGDDWSELCSEMHWSGGFCNNTASNFLEATLKSKGLTEKDLEPLDWEDHLYEFYQSNSDKGLS